MFVKFKRPYFSKDAVHYPARIVVEVPDDTPLPKDAEVIELPKGVDELPDKGPKAIPGFGAQPIHEQELALFGANETHLITEATDAAPGAAGGANVTDKNVEKGTVAKTVTAPAKAEGDKAEDREDLTKDLKASAKK